MAFKDKFDKLISYFDTDEVSDVEERINSTGNGSITSFQAIYVPADDMNDEAVQTITSHTDGQLVLDRKVSEKGIYPAINIFKTSIPFGVSVALTGAFFGAFGALISSSSFTVEILLLNGITFFGFDFSEVFSSLLFSVLSSGITISSSITVFIAPTCLSVSPLIC